MLYRKEFIAYFIWLLIAFSIHTFLYFNPLNSKSSKTQKEIEEAKIEKQSFDFVIKNTTNDTLFKSNKGFLLFKNIDSVAKGTSYQDVLTAITTILNRSYKNQLQIIGGYAEDEIIGLNGHLGIQRALEVSDLLEKDSVDTSQLLPFGAIRPLNFDANNISNRGIEMQLVKMKASQIDSIERVLENTTLQIKVDSTDTLITTRIVTRYRGKLKQYLKEHPESTILITGHTHTVGYGILNFRIGLTYAEQFKSFLVNEGVNGDLIKVASKGEQKPLSWKRNPEAEILNRRVEIKISKP